MTDTSTPAPPLNGQHLAVAARATRVLLDDLLEETGTSFLTWITLNRAAATGGAVDREQLVNELTQALVSDPAPIRAAFDEAEADGLVNQVSRDAATTTGAALDAVVVELTPAGAALHQTIQQRLGGLITELYSGLPHDELATTARVLTEVTERARALRQRTPIPGR